MSNLRVAMLTGVFVAVVGSVLIHGQWLLVRRVRPNQGNPLGQVLGAVNLAVVP